MNKIIIILLILGMYLFAADQINFNDTLSVNEKTYSSAITTPETGCNGSIFGITNVSGVAGITSDSASFGLMLQKGYQITNFQNKRDTAWLNAWDTTRQVSISSLGCDTTTIDSTVSFSIPLMDKLATDSVRYFFESHLLRFYAVGDSTTKQGKPIRIKGNIYIGN